MLFEVVIVEKPTVNQMNAGELEKVIIGPKLIVAKDAQQAGMKVALDESLPKIDRDRMEILVRSF